MWLEVEALENRLTPAAPNPLNLSGLLPPAGFTLNGANAHDLAGLSAKSAGDVNGDGFDDLLIGVPFASPNGHTNAGAVYVVFGKPGGFAGSFDLGSLDGTNGFVLNGVTVKYQHQQRFSALGAARPANDAYFYGSPAIAPNTTTAILLDGLQADIKLAPGSIERGSPTSAHLDLPSACLRGART